MSKRRNFLINRLRDLSAILLYIICFNGVGTRWFPFAEHLFLGYIGEPSLLRGSNPVTPKLDFGRSFSGRDWPFDLGFMTQGKTPNWVRFHFDARVLNFVVASDGTYWEWKFEIAEWLAILLTAPSLIVSIALFIRRRPWRHWRLPIRYWRNWPLVGRRKLARGFPIYPAAVAERSGEGKN